MAQHTIRPIDLTDLSGGLRCDVPSHDIAPNQLYDIQNFDVDSPGRLLSRKGYRRVSDVGIALAPVRGVYEHIERDGRKHTIAACNGRLWRLNERNRTWSEIYRESANVTSWSYNLLHGNFDGSGDDQLNYPIGVAVDVTNDRLYIADRGNYRIMVRKASDLTYIAKYGSPGSGDDQLDYPCSVAVDVTNDRLYIADSNNSRIMVRKASDLTYLAKYGSFGTGNDQLNFPIGVAVDVTNDRLYIADSNNSRIMVRKASDLTYLAKYGSFGTGEMGGWEIANSGTNTVIERDTTNPYAGAGCLKIISTEPTELVVDGGLETWTSATNLTNWVETTTGGSIDRWTINPHSGSYCARRSTYTRQNAYITPNAFIPITPSIAYDCLAWAKSSGDLTTKWFYYRILFYNSGGTYISSFDPIPGVAVTSAWEQKTGTPTPADIPSGATQVKIQVWWYQTYFDYSYYIDDISFKARPIFAGLVTSPAVAIVPGNRRFISYKIKRSSAGDYSGMTLVVLVNYYKNGDSLGAFSLGIPTTLTTYTTINVQQAANSAPSDATSMRIIFWVSGSCAAAAGHGWYIDEVEIYEVDDSSNVTTPLVVDEKVNPTFVSFMGNCYIFGYDKNIKLVNAKAVEFVPSYPESAHFCITHLNRLFLAGDPDFPSRLYFTGLTAGGQVNPDVIDPFDFIDFDPDDGDRITGISPCGAGIVVFKRRGTFMLTGSNETDFFVRKVSSAIGCASHRSIARYQGSVIFLDDNNPGVFMFDGSTNFTMLSRHIDPLIARIVYRDKAVAQIKNERYYLFCDDENAVHPYNENVYVYSLKIGSWTKYAGIYAESVCKGEKDLFTGSAADDGLVFRLFDGYEDDGADIESYITTGDNQFRKAGVESRVRKVTVIADSGTDDQEIDISYASDRAYLMTDASPMSLAAIGTNKWGVGEWDDAVWEGPQMVRHKFVPSANAAKQFRVKLAHTGKEPVKIYGLVIMERERRLRS